MHKLLASVLSLVLLLSLIQPSLADTSLKGTPVTFDFRILGWKLTDKLGKPCNASVSVTVWIKDGKTVEDASGYKIYFQNVGLMEVETVLSLRSIEKEMTMKTVFVFDPKRVPEKHEETMRSLKEVWEDPDLPFVWKQVPYVAITFTPQHPKKPKQEDL